MLFWAIDQRKRSMVQFEEQVTRRSIFHAFRLIFSECRGSISQADSGCMHVAALPAGSPLPEPAEKSARRGRPSRACQPSHFLAANHNE